MSRENYLSGISLKKHITNIYRSMITQEERAKLQTIEPPSEFPSGSENVDWSIPQMVGISPANLPTIVATIDKDDSTFASAPYKATVTHNMNTEDIVVQLFDSSTKETVYADVTKKNFDGSDSVLAITVEFSAVPANDVEVVINSLALAQIGTVSYS